MLTGDLARFSIQGDMVKPRYITRRNAFRYIHLCRALIELYRSHVGQPMGHLQHALLEIEGGRPDYKIMRGLAKLLDEACEFSPVKEMDYPAFRERVFSFIQPHYPVVTKPNLVHPRGRLDVLSAIGAEVGVSSSEVEALLYGDLPENRILSSFQGNLTPEGLLKRYNLALAQAVLYHAKGMRIRITGDFRVLFHYLRLSRLMHDIRKIPDGYDVLIDGPASLFSNTQRYGVRMAVFLPGLLLAKGWSMAADSRTSEGIKKFLLNSNSGLTSHYPSLPPFDSKVEETFFCKFAKKKREWTIEREGDIVVLKDSVFIPDFTFRRGDGKIVNMEIVGYWTPEYLTKKMSKIHKTGPDRLIVAVNRSLNCGREDFKGEWIDYTTGIRIKDVLERLERVAGEIST
jgi:predicted nuclease of restriction endonuclease-like RecB superfamily